VYDHNTSRRRADRRKALPSGVPDVMFENPESVDALDFKVSLNIPVKGNAQICMNM
jgi:hypothetical protein